jgi:hypothetical protein
MKIRLKSFSIFIIILTTLLLQLINLSRNPVEYFFSTDQKVMNFSTTIKVNSLDRFPNAQENEVKKNEVNFVSEIRDTLNVYIPFRSGSIPFMGYRFMDVKENDEIKLIILSSREIYLFKNNLIIYTHRYENPLFYTKISKPNLINAGNTQLTELVAKYQVSQDKEWLNGRSFLSILLLAFCSLWLGVFARKRSEVSTSQLQMISNKGKFQFLLVSISFYTFLFLKWYLVSKDPVGTKNLTPFGPSGAIFSDFYQIATIATFNSIYESSTTNYPPFGILILKIFNNFSYLAALVMIIFFCAGVLVGNFNFSGKNGILNFSITLSSFPFLFAVARGNLDLLACAFLILALTVFKKNKYIWAIILLAIAVALKLWPIVFIVIFLKKSLRLAALVGITSFMLSIFSFLILGHQSLILFLKVILSALFSGNAGTSMEFQNTYSIKTVFVLFHMLLNSNSPMAPDRIDFTKALNFANGIYGVSMLLLLLCFIMFIIKKTNELKYQFFFTSTIVLLISSPSYIYRGIILIYAFQLLYEQADSSADRINLGIISFDLSKLKNILWLLIFAPTSFYYFSEKSVSTSSLIVPLSLLTLLLLYAKESGGILEFRLFITSIKRAFDKLFSKIEHQRVS